MGGVFVMTGKAGLIHHIEINVSNMERSSQFWGWFLNEIGYELFQKWDEGISWKLGDTYLVFVQTGDRYLSDSYHRCRVGLNHLAFHAESRQQVDTITAKLRSLGMRILYQDKHPYAGGEKHYAVFFEDPDRVKVELVAPLDS
jgi:catechol 2,3-dioxygenase-like lactoylglutathione lyase family enzyme